LRVERMFWIPMPRTRGLQDNLRRIRVEDLDVEKYGCIQRVVVACST
jgi:hypothetical protein